MTKDEGGDDQPITNGRQLLCYSQTWDCAAFIGLEGTNKYHLRVLSSLVLY